MDLNELPGNILNSSEQPGLPIETLFQKTNQCLPLPQAHMI
jgi:hypothetical protein